MPIPAPTKTWQTTYSGGNSANVRLVSTGTALSDYQTAMKRIKDILLGFTSTPATVKYSCDGTTAGSAGDGVDRWSAITKLVWAASGSAHSWFVMGLPGIAAGFQVCIDLNSASISNASIFVSPSAGFTGGSTTARPTATDEYPVISIANWWDPSGGAITTVMTVVQSTDGQCIHVYGWHSGFLEVVWILQKPANPVSGWTNPFFGMVVTKTNLLAPKYENVFAASPGVIRVGSTTGAAYLTTEIHGAGRSMQRAPKKHDQSSPKSFTAIPVGIACATAGALGRYGTLFDVYSIPTCMRTGDTWPNSSSRVWLVANCLLLPCNSEQQRIA